MRAPSYQFHPLQSLASVASTASDAIKVNTLRDDRRYGKQWMLKRRSRGARFITRLANFYFHLAGVPIRFLSDCQSWRGWEINCFRRLNRQFNAFAVGENGICASKLPGESLFVHLKRGTLNDQMLVAAGREFRRAHELWSREYDGPWSHGDATMSNVLYDPVNRAARFIDFEIVHEQSLAAEARHADDLLVFLLDLAGFAAEDQWLPFAMIFLKAYGRRGTIAELKQQLIVPGGLARIWWKVRTNWVSTKKLRRRLGELRQSISRIEKTGT